MPLEERLRITEPKFKEFEADRITRAIGRHTDATDAFNDINATLLRVEGAVGNINTVSNACGHHYGP